MTAARSRRAAARPPATRPAASPATADLAALAGRLTERDRWLVRLVAEHRVLTTEQVALLAFGALPTAQHRLTVLTKLGVLVRFRPVWRYGAGSVPWHYVLGPAGAAVLAAEQGRDPATARYRRGEALAIAHSQRLAHLVGVNGFFAALAGHARRRPDAALLVWLSERQCADRWGRLVRPDGYGRWREGPGEVDFFLEYDRGTEGLDRLLGKLAGYQELLEASGIPTPTLFWFTSPRREAAFRQRLGRPPVPVATASAARPAQPAGAVWLPAGSPGPRRRLAALT